MVDVSGLCAQDGADSTVSDNRWYTDEMGWFEDPSGIYEQRFYDGRQWKSYVIAEGRLFFAPLQFDSANEPVDNGPDESPRLDTQPGPASTNDRHRWLTSMTLAIALLVGTIAIVAWISICM